MLKVKCIFPRSPLKIISVYQRSYRHQNNVQLVIINENWDQHLLLTHLIGNCIPKLMELGQC